MALPKRKMSKSRRNKRRTHQKLSLPSLVKCPQCHEMKEPHKICLQCGYYEGREIISVK